MIDAIAADDPRVRSLVAAIQQGDLAALDEQLARTADLAAVRILDAAGVSRTTLHVAADWPGHFPNGPQVVAKLIRGGAPVNAPVWDAAHRLLARGASTTIWQASALGVLDRVVAYCEARARPTVHELTNAFWHACRGGQDVTAHFLLHRGADRNWVGPDRTTPLDAAEASGNAALVQWLIEAGAVRAPARTNARA